MGSHYKTIIAANNVASEYVTYVFNVDNYILIDNIKNHFVSKNNYIINSKWKFFNSINIKQKLSKSLKISYQLFPTTIRVICTYNEYDINEKLQELIKILNEGIDINISENNQIDHINFVNKSINLIPGNAYSFYMIRMPILNKMWDLGIELNDILDASELQIIYLNKPIMKLLYMINDESIPIFIVAVNLNGMNESISLSYISLFETRSKIFDISFNFLKKIENLLT